MPILPAQLFHLPTFPPSHLLVPATPDLDYSLTAERFGGFQAGGTPGRNQTGTGGD